MKLFPLKIHEILFLSAGLGTLAGVIWFEQIGIQLWVATKTAYLMGVIFFVINTFKDVRN